MRKGGKALMWADGSENLAVLPGKVGRTLGLLWEVMRAVCHGCSRKGCHGYHPREGRVGSNMASVGSRDICFQQHHMHKDGRLSTKNLVPLCVPPTPEIGHPSILSQEMGQGQMSLPSQPPLFCSLGEAAD